MTIFRNEYQQFNLDPKLSHALREAQRYEGLSLDPVGKAKSLQRYGRREDVGTSWVTLGHFEGENHAPLLTTNGVTSIISSDAADVGIPVFLECHTISGTDLSFTTQVAVLNGQTAVTLDTPVARVSRMVNAGDTDLAGTVSVYEGGATSGGVVTDATEVHIQIPAGENNSYKAQTSISSVDYYIVSAAHAELEGSNTARVSLRGQVRPPGGVWITEFEAGLGNAGSTHAIFNFDPYLLVPPNYEIRIAAKSSTSGTEVSGYFAGYLASIL